MSVVISFKKKLLEIVWLIFLAYQPIQYVRCANRHLGICIWLIYFQLLEVSTDYY